MTVYGVSAPNTLSALYDSFGVDIWSGDDDGQPMENHVAWVAADVPTINEDGVWDDGAEIDALILSAGYRRTSEWTTGSDDVLYADIEEEK